MTQLFYLLKTGDASERIGVAVIAILIIIGAMALFNFIGEKSSVAKKEKKAVKTQDPDSLHELAMFYFNSKNDLNSALEYLNKALSLNPNHFNSRKDKMILLNSSKRYYEAKPLMEQFIQKDINGEYDIKDDFKAALDDLTKGHIAYFYGYVKKSEGQFSESEQLKKLAFKFHPTSTASLY